MSQQLAWLDALGSGDPMRVEEAQRSIASSVRVSQGVVSATPLGVDGSETVMRMSKRVGSSKKGIGDGGGSLASWSAGLLPPHSAHPSSGVALDHGSISGRSSVKLGRCSASTAPQALSIFQARFTSQDNEVFRQNLDARVTNLRRRLWWLHSSTPSPHTGLAALKDVPASHSGGKKNPQLLCNQPSTMRKAVVSQALVASSAVAPPQKPRNYGGSSWGWRAQNSLFFPPTLEASRDVSFLATTPSLSAAYSGLDLCLPAARVYYPPRLKATRFPSHARTTDTVVKGSMLETEGERDAITMELPHQRVGGEGEFFFSYHSGKGGIAPRPYPLLPTPILIPRATPSSLPPPGNYSTGGPTQSGSGSGSEWGRTEEGAPSDSIVTHMTPIITWGILEGPPILLDPSPPPSVPTESFSPPATAAQLAAAFGISRECIGLGKEGGEGSSLFSVPPPSSRELTHQRLLRKISGGGSTTFPQTGGGGSPRPCSTQQGWCDIKLLGCVVFGGCWGRYTHLRGCRFAARCSCGGGSSIPCQTPSHFLLLLRNFCWGLYWEEEWDDWELSACWFGRCGCAALTASFCQGARAATD